MDELEEIIQSFLVESAEGLAQDLGVVLVGLAAEGDEADRLHGA